MKVLKEDVILYKQFFYKSNSKKYLKINFIFLSGTII